MATPGFEPVNSASLVQHCYHCATGTSDFHLLKISGIELWCIGNGGGIVLIEPVRDFLFGHT